MKTSSQQLRRYSAATLFSHLIHGLTRQDFAMDRSPRTRPIVPRNSSAAKLSQLRQMHSFEAILRDIGVENLDPLFVLLMLLWPIRVA